MADPYRDFLNSRGRLLLGADGVPQIEIADRTPFRLVTPVWDDLRFPASGINPPGPDNAPTRSTTTGLLEFDAAATNVLAFQVQMPHAWQEGSRIEPHIHWMPSTTNAGNVLWQLDYKIVDVNATLPANYTTLSVLQAAAGIANRHQIAGLDSIDMTGTKISCMILCLLSRIGDDATDTFTGVAQLLEIDIHYQIDGFGSVDEYVK